MNVNDSEQNLNLYIAPNFLKKFVLTQFLKMTQMQMNVTFLKKSSVVVEKMSSKAGYIQSFLISILQPSESYIKR